jgi:hypothetical protein
VCCSRVETPEEEVMLGQTRDQLRAADTDRDAIVQRLAAAMSEGRLPLDEYHQRLEQAFAATTYAGLDRLVADLPAVAQRDVAASPQVEPKPAVPLPVLGACVRCVTGLPAACLMLALILILAILA